VEAGVGIFRRFRAVFALAALVSLAACTSWRPYEMLPSSMQLPSQVRVTLEDGQEITLHDPFVLADTLLHGSVGSGGALRTFSLASVQQLETRRFDAGKTGALVVFTVVGAGLAAYGIVLHSLNY